MELNNVFNNLKNAGVLGEMQPFFIGKNCVVQVTNRCNLRCTPCSFFPEREDVVDFEKLKAWVIKKRNAGEILSLSLNGGEPTLEIELCKKIRQLCRENGIICSMVTNGWWGKDNLLREEVRNLELFEIAVSRDKYHATGVDEETFQAAFDFVEEIGTPIRKMFCMTDDDNIFGDKEETIKFFKKMVEVYPDSLVLSSPIRAKTNAVSICLKPHAPATCGVEMPIFLADTNKEGVECLSGFMKFCECPKRKHIKT